MTRSGSASRGRDVWMSDTLGLLRIAWVFWTVYTNSPYGKLFEPWTILLHMDCRRASGRGGSACLTDQVWSLLLQLSFNSVHHHFGATAAELNLAPTQAMA